MPPGNDKRIEALRTKRAQIDAELTRLHAQSRAEERKADTRRKILIGAIILQEMEAQLEIDAWVRKLLQERLRKDRDRTLFGLLPLPSAPDDIH